MYFHLSKSKRFADCLESDGFIFKYWSDKGTHNKSTTKELIYDSCGINIFEDVGYKGLSQQKCIQKIWDECSPQIIAKLLKALSDYFCFKMGTDWWSDEDNYDYQQVQHIRAIANSPNS